MRPDTGTDALELPLSQPMFARVSAPSVSKIGNDELKNVEHALDGRYSWMGSAILCLKDARGASTDEVVWTFEDVRFADMDTTVFLKV